ncbi:gamma-secretase subunit aph-1 [Anaeramoeba flamelloides]|uniref:Gamma-secretase subunit aph-1 n=1 Tax=Anaeramoeba flamelloides TaxID=1746091 RepID=A0AAV7YEV4_9EUKA|nr:gamma-secretase subunit aph-1 [Anaeramoeba flamelloides]
MSVIRFLGCLFITYAPLFVLICQYVLLDAKLLIIALSSCFFWMISILFTSLIWLAVPPLYETNIWIIIVSFVCQEITRYLFFRLLLLLERTINYHSRLGQRQSEIHYIKGSLASGLGFGVGYVLVMNTGLLTKAAGPGDLEASGCSMSLFVLNSFNAQIFGLLNVAWTMIMFIVLKQSKYKYGQTREKHILKLKVIVSLVSHFAASCITMIDNCAVTLTLLYLLLICICVLAVYITFGHIKGKKDEFSTIIQDRIPLGLNDSNSDKKSKHENEKEKVKEKKDSSSSTTASSSESN